MSTVPSIRTNIIANFAGKAWAGLFSLAFVPLYVKLMGVEVYGLLGVFMSLSALLSLLDMGLSTTLCRELSRLSATENSIQESRNLVRTFEVVYWGIGILIGFSVVALAPLITRYWISSDSISSEVIEQALVIMGISLAFQWPAAIYSGGLMGLQHQVALNLIRSVTITIQHGGAVLVLLFISSSVLVFLFWQAMAGLFATIVLAIWLWKSLPLNEEKPHFDKTLLTNNWRFATGMTGISLVVVVLTQLDKIILSKMLTLEMFGYYMLAFSVANVLSSFVAPIFSALYPKFTQLATTNEEDKLISLYHKGCQFISVLVLPLAITIAIYSETILALWLNNLSMAQNTHQILTLLTIGMALNAVMTLPYALQIAYGWTNLAFYKNVIAVVILVPLLIWMAQKYQGIGAAWVWVILNLAYLIFEVPIMHRRLLKGEMGKWYKQDIIKPMLIIISIGLILRAAIPSDASKLVMLAWILITLALSLIAAAYAAGYLNTKILKVIRP